MSVRKDKLLSAVVEISGESYLKIAEIVGFYAGANTFHVRNLKSG